MSSLLNICLRVSGRGFVAKTMSLAFLFSCCVSSVGCAQWQASEKGTIVGAAAGGALGSAIGKKSGNPITGAILGAIGGGIVGKSVGDGIEDRRALQQQQQYYQQPAYQSVPAGVSLDQVISLSRSGLSDEVIISHVESKGFSQTLTTNDLILLKNNGVSDRVIGALQRPVAVPAPTIVQPTVVQPSVRVVEEVRVVPSYYYRPRPVYHPMPHHHHHRSSSLNLHFGF